MQAEKSPSGNFAARIDSRIKALGLNGKTLAEKVQVTPTAITRYRQGRVPGTEEALRLAAALGVNVTWLVTGEGPMSGIPGIDGTAPLYSPQLGAKQRILKSEQLVKEAAEFRRLAERHQEESADFLERAEAYEAWAQSILDLGDDDEE